MRKMNVHLSVTKMRAFFDSLDADSSGECRTVHAASQPKRCYVGRLDKRLHHLFGCVVRASKYGLNKTQQNGPNHLGLCFYHACSKMD